MTVKTVNAFNNNNYIQYESIGDKISHYQLKNTSI